MSIQSASMPYTGRVSRELADLLHRNGMRAQLGVEGDNYFLFVQGHDSPPIRYRITEQQMRALSEGGTNFSNKRAYNTFNSIVKNDFDMPSSYVAARNALGSVSMGLHGYRESPYGFGDDRPMPYHAFGPGFLGWKPLHQDGFQLRRIGGTVMVPEHSDGRLRPGELQSGSYGYYYKGQSSAVQSGSANHNGQTGEDVLAGMMKVDPEPVEFPPRPKEAALLYKEHIPSDVYFTNDKFLEVLKEHGIIIDSKNHQLKIQSADAPNKEYDLSEAQLKKLTSNDLSEVSVQQRLDIINDIIKIDFKDAITVDMLNSKEWLHIGLHPEVARALQLEMAARTGYGDPLLQNSGQSVSNPRSQREFLSPHQDSERGFVDVQEGTDERKGWYREGRHGREVEVSELWVEKRSKDGDRKPTVAELNSGDNLKYRMCAVINGEVITHEISQKQYEKFLVVDDYHRQRMMSKIFDEVDMKTRPGMGFNLPAFLAAGLVAMRDATYLGADIAHNIDRIKNPGPRPELYQEVHGSVRMLHNPAIETPQELAQRAFEEGMRTGMDLDRGLGR